MVRNRKPRMSEIPSTHRPLLRTIPHIRTIRPVPGYQMPGSRLTINNPNPTNMVDSQPSTPPLLVARARWMKRMVKLTSGNRD